MDKPKMKITYATLSADNQELRTTLDEAIERVKVEWLGREYPMHINGKAVYTEEKLNDVSPINTDLKLGTFQWGARRHSKEAVAAARAAFPAWRSTPWRERVAIIREAASGMDELIFELSTILILEVGKSRLEALAEVSETVDLLRYYADSMEANGGFVNELGKLRPDDPAEHNFSVLCPYGVWVVISPFNFPMALASAPIAAALVSGNTVVFKGSPDTPYAAALVTQIFVEAGTPPGVFNSVMGPDNAVGQELLDNPEVDGWTFTGSYQVGMKVLRQAAQGPFAKPAIVEMGGKNPTIVSPTADLDRAALGVARAAFGMSGQKCSACSRVYVHQDVYDDFRQRLTELAAGLKVDDPTQADAFMGTVIHKEAYDKFKAYVAQARADNGHVYGGEVLTQGDLAKGYFVTPTIIEGLAEDHSLVKDELFVPILHLARVSSLEEAMALANNTQYGLTAGFFGQEVTWFFDNIRAGTTYTNRTAGATTGAWPGVQAFGGWQASGSTGKGIGGLYTLALYMHEQSRTVID
jgi:1-pyrroline-5-carboxylate dehydrogenase